jgi:drug/metabolite transporter (DMT)-like permease
MTFCALLLTLSGALLVYLAHAQQRLLRLPLPWPGQAAGSAALLMGTLVWCKSQGVGAGVAGALTAAMCTWVLLPYIAWWSGRHTRERTG